MAKKKLPYIIGDFIICKKAEASGEDDNVASVRWDLIFGVNSRKWQGREQSEIVCAPNREGNYYSVIVSHSPTTVLKMVEKARKSFLEAVP